MKYFIEGWLHHKNLIAIHLMKNSGLDIDFTYNEYEKYDCIINTDSFKEYPGHEGLIIYGPHILFSDVDNSKQFTKNALFNTLSPWLKSLVEKIKPNLNCVNLPFAVDTDRFKPHKKIGKPVLYYKNVSIERLQDVLIYLKNDFIVFDPRLGYNESGFLDAISKAPYAIWIGCHESQGFAFQETMSCDTPIFVIDVKSLREEKDSIWIDYNPGIELKATSASYFDSSCGIVSYPETWKNDINVFFMKLHDYSPRHFITSNLSGQACCKTWNKNLSDIKQAIYI